MEYELKQLPEDFIVQETPAAKDEGKGSYFYYWLQKKDCNTIRAIKLISEKLGISIKRFGWAGNKDKTAVTMQLISIQDLGREKTERLELKGISLHHYGRGSQRIYIGNLEGNTFTITIRNLSSDDYEKIKRNCETLKQSDFLIPNYFDEQRFGKINTDVGEALLRRDFTKAAGLIYRRAEENPVIALARVHKSVLSMYIHSYQSLLFNEILSEYINDFGNFAAVDYSKGKLLFPREKIRNAKLPIIGFGTELGNDKISLIAAGVMKKHSLTQRDFVIRQLPSLTAEGTLRDALVPVKGLEIGTLQEDELNSGMKKCTISFGLEKGCYATIAVKALTC